MRLTPLCGVLVSLQLALRMRSIAKAFYGLACLLGLLFLTVARLDFWWHRFGGPQAQFVRKMLMFTWVSFASVFPIAAVLMTVYWPVETTDLRRTLTFASLVLLLLVWLLSSSAVLLLLVLGPHWD